MRKSIIAVSVTAITASMTLGIHQDASANSVPAYAGNPQDPSTATDFSYNYGNVEMTNINKRSDSYCIPLTTVTNNAHDVSMNVSYTQSLFSGMECYAESITTGGTTYQWSNGNVQPSTAPGVVGSIYLGAVPTPSGGVLYACCSMEYQNYIYSAEFAQ